MCCVKYLTVTFSADLPAKINLFPPAKHGFIKSVPLNAFALKAATNAVIAGTLVMIWNFLLAVRL